MNTRAFGLMCLLRFVASGPLGCPVARNTHVAPAAVAQWVLQPNTVGADGNSTLSYQLTAYSATGGAWQGARLAVDASDAHVVVEQPPLADGRGATSAALRCTQAG